MSSDDLKDYASSSHDFYALLGVTFENSESDIKRAYRRAVLKYHPDKNHGDPTANVERFHLVQTAYAVLTDAGVKAAYDNARAARMAKQRQKEQFEGKRRKMADDLERREKGVKRGRADEAEAEAEAEEKLAREIRRLAENGKRMRQQRDEALKRTSFAPTESLDKHDEAAHEDRDPPNGKSKDGESEAKRGGPGAKADQTNTPMRTSTSEIDRTVKLRWPRDAADSMDKTRLARLFSRFGPVESVIPIKEKRIRLPGRREKQVMAMACIVFETVEAARQAIADAPAQEEESWKVFESISWATARGGKSPPTASHHGTSSAPTTPLSSPSFAVSPSVGTTSTPSASPSFEATMRRLREEYKQRLENETRRSDAVEDEDKSDRRMVV